MGQIALLRCCHLCRLPVLLIDSIAKELPVGQLAIRLDSLLFDDTPGLIMDKQIAG